VLNYLCSSTHLIVSWNILVCSSYFFYPYSDFSSTSQELVLLDQSCSTAEDFDEDDDEDDADDDDDDNDEDDDSESTSDDELPTSTVHQDAATKLIQKDIVLVDVRSVLQQWSFCMFLGASVSDV
jgi:hypothetical protein